MSLRTHRISSFLVLCVALIVSLAQAQTPVSQSAATQDTVTLHSRVRLVLLDVLVTDKQGHPVRGLTRDEFQLRENGVPQLLQSVEEHGGGVSSTPPQVKVAGAPNIFTNKQPASGAVWNVLLFDLLNTPTPEQAIAWRQVQKFVQQLPPNQPVALVLMATEPKLLVPFNGGAGGIQKLFLDKKLVASPSPLLDIYNADEEAVIRHMLVKNQKMLQTVSDTRDSVEMNRVAQRVQVAMSAFSSVAQWLAQYPGRKNVYWLSAGFPLSASPQGSLSVISQSRTSEAFKSEFAAQQQEMDKRLQDARVSIFPIDVSGVIGASVPGVNDASTQGADFVGAGGTARLVTQMDKNTTREIDISAQMQEIAQSTGGIMTRNRNDLATALSEDFTRSQDFYTLAYTPGEKDWNGKYRKLELSLKQRGYELSYRRGYYALDAKTNPPTKDDFTLALRPGAAPAEDVLFSAQLKKGTKEIVLDYAIDARTLQFAPITDGRQSAGVDCAVAEFDTAGKLLGTSVIHVDGRVKPEQWASLNQSGFPAHQTVPIAPGMAYLTMGIRDSTTGRFGNHGVALGSEAPAK